MSETTVETMMDSAVKAFGDGIGSISSGMASAMLVVIPAALAIYAVPFVIRKAKAVFGAVSN